MFLHYWSGVMGLGEEAHRGPVTFSSSHLKGAYYQHDITTDAGLDHLA